MKGHNQQKDRERGERRRKGRDVVGFACLLAILAAGCTKAEHAAGVSPAVSGERLVVYPVTEPLRYFAERIGGEDVDVHFPVPADVLDPADWSPDPEVVAAYQHADLVLLNGGGYAAWVARVSLRASRLVDTSAAFRDKMIPLEDAATHSHGPQGSHSHGGVANRFWLDPALAREQASAVAEAFARARPAAEVSFRERHARLDADLEDLDVRLARALKGLTGEPVLFSHPVYSYLSRRYGLTGRSLHWEPDVVPDHSEWQRLRTLLAEQSASVMVWEAPPVRETADRLAELGIPLVVFRTAGVATAAGDFLATMEQNLQHLRSRGAGAQLRSSAATNGFLPVFSFFNFGVGGSE